MDERHWTMPLDAYSAMELYGRLRHEILSWLDLWDCDWLWNLHATVNWVI